MTNDELQAIREREARATPGPWESNSCGLVKGGEMLDEIADTTWDLNEWQSNCNAEFIAHARQDIPALLAEIDRLKRGDFTEEGGKEMNELPIGTRVVITSEDHPRVGDTGRIVSGLVLSSSLGPLYAIMFDNGSESMASLTQLTVLGETYTPARSLGESKREDD